MGDRLKPHLNPGVDVSRLDPAFVESLVRMFGALPPDLAGKLRIGSGYRDEPTQAKLFADAVAKYGSEDAARKWVAPPGKSRHNHGTAVDLAFGDDAVKQWVHANAQAHGLHFPMSWEPWHIEPVGAPRAPGPRWMPSGAAAAGRLPTPAPAGGQPAPAPAGAQPPDIKTLLASLTPSAPQPALAGAGLALTSFGSEIDERRRREEAEKRARLRALFA